MAQLLAEKKFQSFLTQQHPIIFIDEYQDTDKGFMEALTNHFLRPKTGPLIGLFGDHWQNHLSWRSLVSGFSQRRRHRQGAL
ncbi:UvrD-helicase domain-containing protein [Rhizobium beringeri]